MKAAFALFVIMHYPQLPAVHPEIMPYHKQPPAHAVLELKDKYPTSDECQAKARSLNGLRNQPLPGVQGRIAGAHCAVKPVGGK